MKIRTKLDKILRKLIKYQKIHCVCSIKNGLELSSLKQAKDEIIKIFEEIK